MNTQDTPMKPDFEMETEKEFKIFINRRQYTAHRQYMTGRHIKSLAGEDPNDVVWLKTSSGDFEIGDSEKVDLGQPDRIHFFTGEKYMTEG